MVLKPLAVSTSAALVDADGNGTIDAGDSVTVTYTVTNPSSVAATNISLTTGNGDADISCAASTLAAGASMTCTGRLRVAQADVDAGSVTFPAAVARATASDEQLSTSVPAVTLAIQAKAQLSATQRVSLARDRNGDGLVGRGDGLVFRVDVTNSGTASVSNLSIDDALLARWGQGMSCRVTRLAPGATTTCSSDVLNVTQGMVDDGSLTNVAYAVGQSSSGQVRSGRTVTTTALTRGTTSDSGSGSQATTPKPSKPIRRLHLSQYLAKFDDVNGNGALTAGETLNFGFRATNEGTVTLRNLAIIDPRLQDMGVQVTCGRSVLEPGESTSCVSGQVTVTALMGRVGHGFGTNYAHAVAQDASAVSVRSNATQVTQGYFATQLQEGSLASTGADINGILYGGGVAVLLGGLALGISRRREEEDGESDVS